MEIKSKYNVKDKVFYLDPEQNLITKGTIVDIMNWTHRSGFQYDIEDSCHKNHFRNEDEIFSTKEEMLNYLTRY